MFVNLIMLDKFLKQIIIISFLKKNEYIPTTKVIYRHVAFHIGEESVTKKVTFTFFHVS